MPNFPEEKVTDTCRKCSIPQSDWEWLNGEHRELTGVGQRLRLFAEGARGDAKNMLSEERAQCFLAAVSQESWYLAWREWVVKNSKPRFL